MATTIRAAFAAVAMLSSPALACGPDSDCMIGDRTYRIAVPDGAGPFGAIVFMHGYRGSSAGEMANLRMRDVAERLGVALVAPKSGGEDWLLRNAPRRGLVDDALELEYFDALLADVSTRFPVDPARIVASGFSAGGMMTWTLACHRGERFAAFVPVSGTFWAPIPENCPSPPVNLLHIHGTADPVVPMTGRAIADTRQGDVRQAVAMISRGQGYTEPVAEPGAPAGLICSGAETRSGHELLVCLHRGGHTVDAEWIGWAYRHFVEGE